MQESIYCGGNYYCSKSKICYKVAVNAA